MLSKLPPLILSTTLYKLTFAHNIFKVTAVRVVRIKLSKEITVKKHYILEKRFTSAVVLLYVGSFYLLLVHFLMENPHGGMSKCQDEATVSDVCHHCTDHLLDEGMVGGVHAGAQRIKTLSITVVS